MYELYQTRNGSRGSLAEVWIDRTAGLTKKIYKPTGVTIRGTPPLHSTMQEISKLYQNEIYWSLRLKGRYVLEILDHGDLHDEPGHYLIQPYLNPDLLHLYDGKRLDPTIPDPVAQLREMFTWFQHHGVYKLNNAMCNLTHQNGNMIAFDFKYSVPRSSEMRERELHSVETWLSKIDPSLPAVLSDLI